jgi:hypothetical protein
MSWIRSAELMCPNFGDCACATVAMETIERIKNALVIGFIDFDLVVMC